MTRRCSWPVAGVRGAARRTAAAWMLERGEPAAAPARAPVSSVGGSAPAFGDDDRADDLAPGVVRACRRWRSRPLRAVLRSAASTSVGTTISPPVRMTSCSTPDDAQVTVVVDGGQISGVIPAVLQGARRRLGIAVVAVEKQRPAHAKLAGAVGSIRISVAWLGTPQLPGLRCTSSPVSEATLPASVEP